MQPIARVNPKYFAAMNVFRAERDVRYYLEGIFIEPHPEKGVILVATDGHTLGVIHDPDGWVAAPVIVGGISKKLISACASKGIEHRMTVPKLLYISQHGAVVTGDKQVFDEVNPFGPLALHMSKIDIIDGKFPDYRKVIGLNREVSATFPCINSLYLARLHAVAKILVPSYKYGWGVEMISSGRDTTTLVRITSCELEQRFLAVLMPMRTDAPKNPLPDWLMPKAEATTETVTTEAEPC
jgi:DNA polymerase-3 subunit beta